MFYNYHSHEGNVIIVPSTMGIHQGDPGGGGGGGAFFDLNHFRALRSITNHFFSSIVDNIRIISSLSIASFAYEHF